MNGFDHTSGEYLDIDDAKIYYEMKGRHDAPVLLLLHGGLGTMEDFNIIIDDLLPDHKIIGIDSRGQGMSTLGTAALTYERIQNDVIKVLEHLQITGISIIGLSDGGIVAYRLAAMRSVNIDKLVTISSRWNIRDALITKDMFLAITPENYRKSFPDEFDTYQRLNPEPDFARLTKVLVKMWLDPNDSAYLNETIKNIICPLLIVHGDDDDILTNESVVTLSEIIKNSHLLNIPFARHAAFKEQPEIFKLGIRKFFTKYTTQ